MSVTPTVRIVLITSSSSINQLVRNGRMIGGDGARTVATGACFLLVVLDDDDDDLPSALFVIDRDIRVVVMMVSSSTWSSLSSSSSSLSDSSSTPSLSRFLYVYPDTHGSQYATKMVGTQLPCVA